MLPSGTLLGCVASVKQAIELKNVDQNEKVSDSKFKLEF